MKLSRSLVIFGHAQLYNSGLVVFYRYDGCVRDLSVCPAVLIPDPPCGYLFQALVKAKVLILFRAILHTCTN